MKDGSNLYAVALGSNRASGRHTVPRHVIESALIELARDVRILATSPLIETPALGPSLRRFTNSAILIETRLSPFALLALLKRIERDFGRRPGQRWGARPLDLDILLWSGGRLDHSALTIPHRELANRRFVLDPLAAIAPDWRLPRTWLRIRHLRARLLRPRLTRLLASR